MKMDNMNNMSSQNQITAFLEQLSIADPDKYEIVNGLRNIVVEVFPDVTETFKYGGIMFSLDENFGGLFVSKNHVSFEFSYGYKLTSNLKLEGSGRYRRHLKIKQLDDALKDGVRDLLKQIDVIGKS